MDFVDKPNVPLRILAELVLGVHQDQASLCCRLLIRGETMRLMIKFDKTHLRWVEYVEHFEILKAGNCAQTRPEHI